MYKKIYQHVPNSFQNRPIKSKVFLILKIVRQNKITLNFSNYYTFYTSQNENPKLLDLNILVVSYYCSHYQGKLRLNFTSQVV